MTHSSLLLKRLGDDADVGDAGLLDGIHHRGKGAEGHALVGAQVDDAFSGIGIAGSSSSSPGSSLTLTGLSCRKTFWSLVDGDDHALFGELIDGARLGDGDFDAGLQHRRGEHEDEQQHEHHIDQRCDVDLGECGLGASCAKRRPWLEGPPSWLLRLWGNGGWHDHGGVLDGVEQLAAEVVHARGELAQPRGELVVADNSRDGDDQAGGGGDERLGDAGSDSAEGRCAGGAEAVEGVDDAHDGAEEADERRDTSAMVASQVMRLSIAVRASQEAVWAARSRATGLRGMPRPPVCRWYSSWISLKTATSGLGWNCSATAAISLRGVPDLRKARRKRWLCVCALPKLRPLGEHDGPGEDARDEKNDAAL